MMQKPMTHHLPTVSHSDDLFAPQELVCAYEVEVGDTITEGRGRGVVERIEPHHSLPGNRWWTIDGRKFLIKDWRTFWRIDRAA